MLTLYCLLLFCLSATLEAKIARDLAEDAEKYLLPWNIRPEHYDLTLYTHIENFENGNDESFLFMGINEITIQVLYGDVSEVVLHSYDDVEIVSAQITGLDIESPHIYNTTIGSYDSDTNKQTLIVNPPLINNDRYRLTIYYIGNNSDSLRGFYRSSFTDENGNQKWLLTTHFESFGARQAFPSFDEPEYKATFRLTIHYNETLASEGYSAFFNTEIESEEIKNGVHITTFKKTSRPLSTYLVAFILAPFQISPEPAYFNSSFNGENPIKPLRTIGQPKFFSPRQDYLSQVAGPASLNTMTRLTGVGFGLDKVDQAGIPDFGPGAMENWGLVTYRQEAVFFDEVSGTTAQKESVVSTITHELAHQWFGDLVTLHWWTDVWLNEGFATYFATHASNEFREPTLNTSDWNLIGRFVTGTLQNGAMKTDGKPTSRPLTAEAYDRPTINSYFDGISYDKGGSVLRMWMHILGPDIFYSGLNRYLRQQQEGLGTPEILLASWDGEIDSLPDDEKPKLPASVAQLFANWHLQAGYPVISVARYNGELTITQERFLSSPGNDSNKWNVPLTYSTDVEQNFEKTKPVQFLLASEDSTILTLNDGAADWVVINNQETGFYRVNYDDDNWEKLITIVNDPNQFEKIHEFNRAQILDDAENLGASSHKHYLPYKIFLRLLPSLKHDRSPTVWETARRSIISLLSRYSYDQENYSKLKVKIASGKPQATLHLASIVEPAFNDVGMNVLLGETHGEKRLRMIVIQLACFLEVDSCKVQAKKLALSRSFDPDVRGVVMCEMVRRGELPNDIIFASIKKLDTFLADDYIRALSCNSNEVLTSLLNEIKTLNSIATVSLLNYVIENHPGQSIVKDVSSIIIHQNSREVMKPRPILSESLLEVMITPSKYKRISRQQIEIKSWLSSLDL